jgi:hypothetical protein
MGFGIAILEFALAQLDPGGKRESKDNMRASPSSSRWS